MNTEPVKGPGAGVPPQIPSPLPKNGLLERIKNVVFQVFRVFKGLVKASPTSLDRSVSHKNLAQGSKELFNAVATGNPKNVEPLLEQLSAAEINGVDDRGLSAIVHAVATEKVDLVQMMLDHPKCDPNIGGKWGPLTMAIKLVNKETGMKMVEALINCPKMDINFDDGKMFPLELAVSQENVDVIKKLLSREEIDPNLAKGDWPPLEIAILKGRLDIVEILLENRKIDPQFFRGKKTPLELAVSKENVDVIKKLLSRDEIDPNLATSKLTPLELAIEKANSSLVEALLENPKTKLNFTKGKYTPLERAINRWIQGKNRGENRAIVEQLLDDSRTDYRKVNWKDFTLLGPEYKDVTKLLLEKVPRFRLLEKSPKYAHIVDMSGNIKLLFGRIQRTVRRSFFDEELFYQESGLSLRNRRVRASVGKKVTSEGAYTGRTFYKMISSSLREYNDLQGVTYPKEIAEAFACGSLNPKTKKAPTASELFERVKKDKLTVIETGFKNHSVTVLFWEDCFALCNRGGGNRRFLEVHKYNRDLLTEDMVQQMMDAKKLSKSNYKKLYYKKLEKELKFKRQKHLEKAVSLPPQVVGNCAWKSSETAVCAALILAKYREGIKKPREIPRKMFWNWLSYQQNKAVDRLLNLEEKVPSYRVDPRMARVSFCNARATLLKSDDKTNEEKLLELKDQYMSRLPRRQKLRFKVAWIASGTRLPLIKKFR